MRPIHHRPIYAKFYALATLGFLFGIVYGIFSLTLPILAENIFANVALLGVIFALPELVGVFMDIPLGAFARRFGRRHTIFYSALLLIISAVLFMSFRNIFFFTLTLILYEIATQSYIIPADAELMALSPPRKAGEFNGLAEGLHNFGFSIGPILAGMLLVWSVHNPFLLSIAIALVMIMVSISFLPREEGRENFSGAMHNVWRRDHVFSGGFKEARDLGFTGIYLIFLFFIFALHWGFIALLEPLYTNAIGLSPAYIGIIYAGFTIPFLFVSTLVGRYTDHKDAKNIILIGLFLLAVSTLGFGLTHNPKYLFIWSLISGVGDAFLLPAVMALLDRLSSYHKKEHISGVKIFAESSGYFLGPLMAGVATQSIGFNSTFIYLGIVLSAIVLGTVLVPLHSIPASEKSIHR